jgi:hypothetical protein
MTPVILAYKYYEVSVRERAKYRKINNLTCNSLGKAVGFLSSSASIIDGFSGIDG